MRFDSQTGLIATSGELSVITPLKSPKLTTYVQEVHGAARWKGERGRLGREQEALLVRSRATPRSPRRRLGCSATVRDGVQGRAHVEGWITRDYAPAEKPSNRRRSVSNCLGLGCWRRLPGYRRLPVAVPGRYSTARPAISRIQWRTSCFTWTISQVLRPRSRCSAS